jgi:hypothetical protein
MGTHEQEPQFFSLQGNFPIIIAKKNLPRRTKMITNACTMQIKIRFRGCCHYLWVLNRVGLEFYIKIPYNNRSKNFLCCGDLFLDRIKYKNFLRSLALTPEIPPPVFPTSGLVEWVALIATLDGAMRFALF